jgi:endoglucanase
LRTRFTTSFIACAITLAGCVSEPDSSSELDAGSSSTTDAGHTGHLHDAGAPAETDAGTVTPGSDAGTGSVDLDAGAPSLDAGTASEPDAGPPPAPRGVRVVGNRLEKDGVTLQIRGVNRSGSEYSCVQRGGLFDGPTDDASIEAIASWGANAIRIPLNETCWLGINGVAPAAAGAAYQEAILSYVRRIEAHGMTPILDLHWTAPGTRQATEQLPMPDADHSRDFWRSVASAVKDDPYVVLELFNEPWPDWNQDTDAAWRCWRDGGTCPGIDYQAVGMQQLLDDVRSTGATNVVLAGGIRFATTLSQWLEHMPHDPAGQLGAAWHIYQIGFCDTVACFEGAPAAVAAVVPVVATEFGENECNGVYMTTVMDWLDAHGFGYMAWTWNTWGRCLALIEDYTGTPRGPYGGTYRDHLRSLAP